MFPRFGTLTFITPYGLALVLACLLCWWLTRRRAAAAGWDVSHIDFALPLAFVVGAIGVKLMALLVFDRFLLFVLPVFALPVLWFYCRRAGLSMLELGDLIALPLLVWLAVLRIGCFFAGCCWGDVATAAADGVSVAARLQVDTLRVVTAALASIALSFPAGSFASHQHAALGLIGAAESPSMPVLPTQLIESVCLMGLYLVLRRYERGSTRRGAPLFIALAAYVGVRFVIEFLRADNALLIGYLTANQIVCLALLGFAVWRLLRLSDQELIRRGSGCSKP